MQKRFFSYFARFAMIPFVFAVGGFFYAQPVQAQTTRLDLMISDARLTVDALTFTARNIGVDGVPAGQWISFWFEWVNQAGGRVAALVWNDVPTALAPGQFLNFEALHAQFRRERATGGLSDPITFAELMAAAPENATHLKVRVDGPNTYPEVNEQNNVLLLPKPIPPQPDLAISDLRVWPENAITFGIQNSGEAAIGGGVSLWFHGATAGGVQVGPLYWYDVPEIQAGQTQSFNSAGVTVHSEVGDAQLSAVFIGPSEATHFKILLDGPGRITEKNEGNNMALLERPRPPKPDIVIEDATLTNGRLTYTIVNRGNAPVRVAAYNVRFEWLRADGQLTQGHPYPPVYLPFGSNLINGVPGESLRFSSDPPDARYEWLFRSLTDPPIDAVRLRLTADASTPPFEESNEENNVIILERPRPVLPEGGGLPDFAIENAALSYASRGQGMQVGQLTYTIWNRGQGAAPHGELWVGHRWVSANGQPIGDTRYMRFDTALAPDRTVAFDSSAQRPNTRGYAIRELVPYPPLGTTQFELVIDPWGYYREPTDGAQNAVRVDRPLPDFTFASAQYMEGRLTWELENRGSGIPLGRKEGYQWLTDFPIRHEWLNTAGAVLATQNTFVRGTITNGVFSTFDSNTLSAGHPFRAFFATPPAGATQMRIMVDPERVQPETDENNNTITRAVAGNEPEVPETPEEPEEESTPKPPPPPKLPDLTIINATLDTAAFRFWYHNLGETATASASISLWYELVDAQGKRVSELRWINVNAVMPAKSKQQGNQLLDFATLDSERGKITLGNFVNSAPPSATHLKFTIDGPNAHAEANEQNNSVLLPIPKPAALNLPDLALTAGVRAGGVVRLTIVNGTANSIHAPLLQFKWLDAKGATLSTSPVSYWQHETIGSGKTGDFTIEYEKWREDGVIYFLKHPLSGAVALLATIDPENKLKESNEDNNAFRIALGQPDLTLGKAEAAAPELTLTLAVEIIRERASAGAVSSFAGGGLTLALAALLAFGFMIHGHHGGRNGAIGFFSIFPLLFTASNLSYMYLRRCDPQGCTGQHFARYRKLKNATRASLGAVAGFGILKIIVAALAVSVIGPVSDIAAQTLEAYAGDSVRASMVVKNSGTVPATGLLVRLACPQGSVQTGAELNGKTVSADAGSGIAVTDLGPNKTHSLKVFCKIVQTVAGSLRFQGDVKYQEGGDKQISSNAVKVDVRPKPQPQLEGPPDLVVSGVGFLPKTEVTGNNNPFSAAFTAIVKNIGESKTKATQNRLRIDIGGDGTWDFTSPTHIDTGVLQSGEHETASWTIQWTAPLGSYIFEICADAGSQITELSEKNNCVQDRFTLQEGVGATQEEEY